MQQALNYINTAVSHSHSWKLIKPHMLQIIQVNCLTDSGDFGSVKYPFPPPSLLLHLLRNPLLCEERIFYIVMCENSICFGEKNYLSVSFLVALEEVK